VNMLLGLLLFAAPVFAVEVTVYNQNLGLVRETRSFDLQKGVADIEAEDVAAHIDPTSVHFKSLTSPGGVTVLEQDFEYDLISQDKLLEKYLGKEIELEQRLGPNGEKKETVRGTLLSNEGGRVLLSDGRILVNPPGDAVLPKLPEGLRSKPTLLWKLRSDRGGSNECELSYLTEGLGWHADYVTVVSPKDDSMDLNAWVTIDNRSGAAYKDAKLKLVAGDVHRSQPAPRPMMYAKAMAAAAPEANFAEKAFFEYHLYTLQRPTTLADNETKQVELAEAAGVPLTKEYLYDGSGGIMWPGGGRYLSPEWGNNSAAKVAVTLQFANAKSAGLGIPLPQGRVRVYKKDDDGALEFIGEDQIDHTPKDEKVRLHLGDAFDVVGERKRTDLQTGKNSLDESFEIRLRNHKEDPITVKVVERLYRWSEWKIENASQKFTKKDAQTIEFAVPVKPDGESVVTYTVHYSWR
jgi:hypothetical protein